MSEPTAREKCVEQMAQGAWDASAHGELGLDWSDLASAALAALLRSPDLLALLVSEGVLEQVEQGGGYWTENDHWIEFQPLFRSVLIQKEGECE